MSYITRQLGTSLSPTRGATRGYRREQTLALQKIENNSVASTWELFLKTPSRRVSSFLAVTFKTYAPLVTLDYNSSVWTLRAMEEAFNGGGALAELHTIESAVALPRAYEFDSAIRIVRATLTLNNPDNPTNSAHYGQWFARCRWEINTPMEAEEANNLLDACSANASKSA